MGQTVAQQLRPLDTNTARAAYTTAVLLCGGREVDVSACRVKRRRGGRRWGPHREGGRKGKTQRHTGQG